MIETDRLVAYLAACSILALTPGPGILYVMTRTLAGGTREGFLSSVGTFVGGFAHVLAAALGLSAILATSALAFQAVKYAGAAYLIYLGIQMIRRSGHLEVADAPPPKGSPFLQGIVTEALNPKTAIFFLSFIPQFVTHPSFAQFVFLGAISVTLNTLADLLVVAFAAPLVRTLTGTWRRRQQLATGTGMITLGIYVAAD
ncbi:MAG: LysE family translocator [Acidobacteria bacterium]|nr:LysE family translocator [Acidobacteriota bacterium]